MPNIKKYPCANCGKVLFFGNLSVAVISKDCPKCGERNIITATTTAGIKTEKKELVRK